MTGVVVTWFGGPRDGDELELPTTDRPVRVLLDGADGETHEALFWPRQLGDGRWILPFVERYDHE